MLRAEHLSPNVVGETDGVPDGQNVDVEGRFYTAPARAGTWVFATDARTSA